MRRRLATLLLVVLTAVGLLVTAAPAFAHGGSAGWKHMHTHWYYVDGHWWRVDHYRYPHFGRLVHPDHHCRSPIDPRWQSTYPCWNV